MSTWLFDVNFIPTLGGGAPARTNTVFVTSPISSCKKDVLTFSKKFFEMVLAFPAPLPQQQHATKTIFVGGVVMKLIRTPFWKTHITICFLALDLIVSPPSRFNQIALARTTSVHGSVVPAREPHL